MEVQYDQSQLCQTLYEVICEKYKREIFIKIWPHLMCRESLSILMTFPFNRVDKLIWLNSLEKETITTYSHHTIYQDIQTFVHWS